ncbi:Lipase-like protein [Aphelenchoides bicaudatus]|nr:Lipase-like protein [Aphelenchoides bicaudatus]
MNLAGWHLRCLIGIPLFLFIEQISAQTRTGYDPNYARLMFYFSAGAYSPTPGDCVNETSRISGQSFQLYSTAPGDYECDSNSNTCAFYVAVSPTARQIVIVFRGTKSKKQLFHETLQSLQPNVDFYGLGKVNRYFFRALSAMWEPTATILNDPRYQGFTVSFTGHSLGGALAALASMRTVLERLRDSSQIRLYTFGEPRVGNHKFAVEHDRLVPYSFRVINRNDIVPHLPLCHFSDSTDPINDDVVVDQNNPRPVQPEEIRSSSTDDNDFNFSDALKKPCDGDPTRKAYHHGTEIWYPDGMVAEDTFRECTGEPKNEDHTCSNGVHLVNGWPTLQRYINDHTHYFGEKVSSFGKAGCKLTEVIPQPVHQSGQGKQYLHLIKGY